MSPGRGYDMQISAVDVDPEAVRMALRNFMTQLASAERERVSVGHCICLATPVDLWCDGLSDRSHLMHKLSHCSFQSDFTAGVTKAVVCAILSVGWCI